MKKSLIASAVLAMFLAACSSKEVKQEPAKYEDKSATKATEVTPTTTTTDTGTSAGTTAPEVAYNPLKDPNNILSKRSVYFDFDKDAVKDEYRPLIEAHAKYLVEHANTKVVLQGNTDQKGSSEYNLSLGQRRAVAVKKVANVLGVQDKQIETVSFGKEKATGVDDKDRRVDIVYDGE